MTYTVIRDFTDSNANGAENGKLHVYHKGDKYPFKNYAGSLTKDRIANLAKKDGPNEFFNGPVIQENIEELKNTNKGNKSDKVGD